MSNYDVRVELRGNPSFEQYEKLHSLMKGKGFYQTIGSTHDLPHATYFGSSTLDCAKLRDDLQASIKAKVQNSIIVFVVQSATWALGW
jgi:hypothetical protein